MFPTTNAHPTFPFVHASRVLFGLTLVLLLAASTPGFAGWQNAKASVMTPVIETRVVFSDRGLVSIHGEGFSPGGLVQIAFVEQGDSSQPAALRWTVASAAAYGPNGTQDPARGYVPAGSFTEIVNLGASSLYGANGSQDPAQGYHPAMESGSLLAGNITVRAFDQQTSLWSNLATVDPAGLLAGQEIGPNPYDIPRACVAFIPCYPLF